MFEINGQNSEEEVKSRAKSQMCDGTVEVVVASAVWRVWLWFSKHNIETFCFLRQVRRQMRALWGCVQSLRVVS